MIVTYYRISLHKSPGFYFLPSIFDSACKRIGPLFDTGRLFSIGPTDAWHAIEFGWWYNRIAVMVSIENSDTVC